MEAGSDDTSRQNAGQERASAGVPLDRRVRETFAHSRDVVLRAHERALQAVERATRIREALRADREEAQAGRQEARRRVRLLQLAAEESARSAAEKDRFLATVSHELRQPLNAALMALRMMEVGGETAARSQAILRRQLLQMTRLVEDLLDVSRMSLDIMDLKMGHVDLPRILADAVSAISADLAARNQTLVEDVAATNVCVWGDESRLRQVFSNLLSNAVRYTPSGGRITLSASVQQGRAVVSVADTGQGIDQADLQRIFDPFTRGRIGGPPEGLGIGLSVVRGLVQLHGGSSSAASQGPGQGSTFSVTLPLCPHPPVVETQGASTE